MDHLGKFWCFLYNFCLFVDDPIDFFYLWHIQKNSDRLLGSFDRLLGLNFASLLGM